MTQEQSLIQWQQKGLGWIPDYPDIRDYDLSDSESIRNLIDESGRLKRDEISGALEAIADPFLIALNKLGKTEAFIKNVSERLDILNKSVSNKQYDSLLQNQIKELQNFIRSQIMISNTINWDQARRQIEDKIFGNIRFIKIKSYKILRKGIQPCQEVTQVKIALNLIYSLNLLSDENELEKLLSDEPNSKIAWLRSQVFDDVMEKTVIDFQTKKKLHPDGVVGFKTYNSINNSLTKFDSLDQPEIQFVTPPLPIPKTALELVFKKLEKSKKFKVNLISSTNSSNSEDWLEDFKYLFSNEFLIIEPIITVIMQMLFPLAQYDNFEESLDKALDKFVQLADPKSADQNSNPQDKLIRENIHLAVKKLASIAAKEKKELDAERKKESKSSSKIDDRIFHFLESNSYLRQQINHNNLEQSSLDKQYLFEIVDAGQPETTEPNEFISPRSFYIPVSTNLYQNQDESKTNAKRFFFLPSVVDLSYWCSPVEDQGSLNACAAHAGVALLEYFARKQFDKPVEDLSTRFLYKVARNLRHQLGDSGASVRETMKAMVLFGVPPEKYWPRDDENFDAEPPAFCYAFAQNYQTLKYFRLDYADMPEELLLFRIKAVLAAGFPCMFGFTVYSSIYNESNIAQGYIPYPNRKRDKRVGGHAVLAVGYDDYKVVPCADQGRSGSSQGAFLIRNCWGQKWGVKGYGWLPFDYVLKGLTADWWSLLKTEWFQEEQFGLGSPPTTTEDPNNRS